VKRYRVSKNARSDLDAIYRYWAERAGLDAADRLIDAIVDRFWVLAEHLEAGPAASDIAPGVRCFPAGKYLIYYRKARRGVEILHVFHGNRDQHKAWRRGK
jgi:toxin ParE1/3/4